jgi:hypothetical protein
MSIGLYLMFRVVFHGKTTADYLFNLILLAMLRCYSSMQDFISMKNSRSGYRGRRRGGFAVKTLENKKILITGATDGIGKRAATDLAARERP